MDGTTGVEEPPNYEACGRGIELHTKVTTTTATATKTTTTTTTTTRNVIHSEKVPIRRDQNAKHHMNFSGAWCDKGRERIEEEVVAGLGGRRYKNRGGKIENDQNDKTQVFWTWSSFRSRTEKHAKFYNRYNSG